MAKVQMLALQSIDGYIIDDRPELSAVLSDEIAKLRTAATHLLNKDVSNGIDRRDCSLHDTRYSRSRQTAVSIPTARNLLEMFCHPYLHERHGAGRFSSEQLTDA